MSSLNFNLFNVIILLGILHGVIFSSVILFNKKFKSKTNFYLALTTLALCGSNLQYLLIDIGILLKKSYEGGLIFIPFEFLMIPMFYFFVKSYLNLKIINKTICFLLTPFFIAVLYQILTKLFGLEYKIIEHLNKGEEVLSLIFSVFLIIMIFKEINLYRIKVNSLNFKGIPKATGWLKKTLVFGLILCFLWGISITIFKSYYEKGLYKYYPLWIGISILIYWIGYISVIQNILYNERKSLRKKSLHKNTLNKKPNKQKFNEIHIFILNNKLYLNPNMSLSFLAEKVNISEGYLSQLINKNYKKSYNDYINSLRIEHVKKILVDDEYINYTITAIGLESGFKTKTNFYATFKKITGKTPNQYKKSVQNL